MKFELLHSKNHDRKSFDCGVEPLNLYLKKFANQDQKRNLTRVYVLADGPIIIGYYSISAHSVSRENIPKDILIGGYKSIPFLLLGRLAVDKDYQKQGYGDTLIFHAFKITAETAGKVGIQGMIVDAKNDDAVKFYEGFGFKRLKLKRYRLILPIKALNKLI